MDQSPEYLTLKEAAELLKVSKNTLLRAIDRGDIPVITVGERTRRIRRDVLETLATSDE